MKYNLLQHSSHHSTTYRVTLHLNSTHLTHFHIIHVLKDLNTIPLNQSISINTQALCSKYTKSQSYMQCGTLSVKNLVGHTWVHDKTDHTRVGWATLTSWNHKESYYFVRMLQPSGIDTSLKEHSSRVYLLPRPRLRRVRQGISLLI